MGTYVKGESKIRPGIYHTYENAGNVPVAGARNGIGAGALRCSWGPLGKVVALTPADDVGTAFGDGKGRDIITAMFQGGIGSGLFVRVGTGGKAGAAELKDADDVVCATLTADYVGKRDFTYTIRDSLSDRKRELIVYEGTAEFVKVSFPSGGNEAAALGAALKGKPFTVAPQEGYSGDGVLKAVVQESLAGGEDPTVTTADYGTAFSVLEAEIWNVLCVDTTDVAVHTLVKAFVDRVYAAGGYPMACVAEGSEVALEERMEHARAMNDEKMHYVLNSGADATGVVYEGYRLAALIGGMIAAVPANSMLTGAVVSPLSKLTEKLTNTEIEAAIKSGCLVLSENRKKQVQVEDGVNTLVTPGSDQDEGWKKIRRVKTRFELMDRIDATLEALRVDNDKDGRGAIIAAGNSVISAMVGEKKLIDGSVTEDETNPAAGDSAWFVIDVDDKDGLERVYLRYRFRFAPEN